MYEACNLGHIDIVKLLLRVPSIDINTNDPNLFQGSNPLYVACEYGDTEIVKLLLALPIINVNIRNKRVFEKNILGVHFILRAKMGISRLLNSYLLFHQLISTLKELYFMGHSICAAYINNHIDIFKLLIAEPNLKIMKMV